MKNRYTILLIIPLIALLVYPVSCIASDPLPDTLYTRDLLPGDDSTHNIPPGTTVDGGSEDIPYGAGYFDDIFIAEDLTVAGDLTLGGDLFITWSVHKFAADGNGGYWHEYNIPAINISPGGSGATQIVPNVSTLGGFRLDNITEVLYFTTHVESDYDGVTDGVVAIYFEVNVDNTGGNDADTVDFQLECWHKFQGEFGNTVNSHDGTTTVGKSDQHELFEQKIIMDDIAAGQVIAFRINLNTIFSEVDNVIVNYIEFKYQTFHPSPEVN